MSRSKHHEPFEPNKSRDPIGVLEGRWTLQILLRLKVGDMRFSDLRAALPAVSANILTQRLRELEAAGLIERRYLSPPAASHVYGFARSAQTLRPALDHLAAWSARQPSVA